MDSSKSIKMELIHFREHAEKGYKLASQKYSEIRDTLREEEKKIKETNRKQNELSLLQNSSIIDEQMKALTLLKTRVENIGKDIIALHAQQKEFSIVIYGRTMVGKSTLMEILTHGDGKSIGKGAQRTTLDVRSYYWNGLKIIDVPGVCSFESEEDDKIAFEAAKSADLVLFLITDDAPQAGEAKALAQIRRLGKPVLGIINGIQNSLKVPKEEFSDSIMTLKRYSTTKLINLLRLITKIRMLLLIGKDILKC